jgi:hypothetical protein
MQISASSQMRTTLDLNDDLLVEAKAMAAREKLSLTRLIEEGLALRLRHASVPATAGVEPLPVHRGRGGLTDAVVDPLRNRSLLEAADGLSPP